MEKAISKSSAEQRTEGSNQNVSKAFWEVPSPVKIGAYDWHIQPEEGDDKHGEADFENHLIRIWVGTITSPSHLVGIVLHECLHVIFDNEKLSKLKKDKEDREEQIVLGFEAGLVSLFRDNPKLVNWIKKWLK
jgi:hypothetical protein